MHPRIRLCYAIVASAVLLGIFALASRHVEAQSGGSLSLVSFNAAGTSSGNGASTYARSSADGRYVAFVSSATNLTNIPDNNGVSDVFVRDLTTGTTTLVSVNSAGTASGNSTSSYGNGSRNPSISADGRYVVFDSVSSDLVANLDTNTARDVFVRDLVTQTTTLVSVNAAGTGSGNNESSNASISADGSTVAFASIATNLTNISDPTYFYDVFVRNLNTGTTVLASVNSSGNGVGNGNSSYGADYYSNSVPPSLSSDGRYVAFPSAATNLTTLNDTNGSNDGFVRDLVAGVTYLVSVNSSGTASGSVSGGCCYGDIVSGLTLSGNGQFVVFSSAASNLVANDNNSATDVFVRILAENKTILVSVNNTGLGGGNGSSLSPKITPDGRYVVFESTANNLIVNDTNGGSYSNYNDIFIRDLTAQTTTLVSVNRTGTNTGNDSSNTASISDDGRFVAFISSANDLAGNSTNYYSVRNVFVRDVQASTTTQASYNNAGAVGANGDAYNVSISASGQRVAFDSTANNVVSNDFNSNYDVFAYTVNQTLPLTVSINDAIILEGNTGTTTATFTVRLSAPSANPVTVNYASADGTAFSNPDYQGVSGTLNFAPGTTTQNINVTINNDLLDEADENFTIALTSPVGAALGDGSGAALILDNDPLPVISISDISVLEGDTGNRNAVFQLSLNAPSGRTVSVQTGTSDGTATTNYDYNQIYYGYVNFAPGATTATISVNIVGDTLREGDETFYLNLSSPTNATLSDNQAVCTIVDESSDLGVPSLSVGDSYAYEGNSPAIVNFYVTLSTPFNQPVTVAYATADNTATAGSDYVATGGTLTFNPGQTSQTISVPVLNDTVIESSETFSLNLSNPINATITRGQAMGTINDDDRRAELNFYQSNYNYNGVRISEDGGSLTLTVSRSYNSVGTVTVQYATSNGTATAGSDYTATNGTLTFAEGVTQQSFTIPIIDDGALESSESFNVTLSNPTNATLGSDRVVAVNIIDNDAGNGSVIISEFRFRGPSGTQDEFIELYNNTDYNITVGTTDGSRGWTLAALSDTGTSASPRFTIPNDTVLPARGHYLATYVSNSYNDPNQYSLGSYGSYNGYNGATGNTTYQTYTAENGGIALFRTANQINFNIANRLDAVGFKEMTTPVADLYREGMGLTYADTGDAEMSYVRRMTNMTPQDTGDNAADFVLVSTTGGMFGAIQSVLGAPGPENASSPIRRDSSISASYVDPLACGACVPNRVVAGEGATRTLTIRRRFTNGTGQYISRLRFRVIDITTLGSEVAVPPQAELRLTDAPDASVNTSLGIVNVKGAILEQPPTQAMGGGLNSSLTLALSSSLAPGSSVDAQFLMNLVQGGRFRFYISVEALP